MGEQVMDTDRAQVARAFAEALRNPQHTAIPQLQEFAEAVSLLHARAGTLMHTPTLSLLSPI